MLTGAYTAIITPFGRDGAVDYDKLRALINLQIEGGMDGIVPVGTTGESPTLDFDEHSRVIETTVEVCRGRVKVIAGTGGNATAEALRLTRHAKDAGADATLQVTPYYNRPSQEGLYRHFSAVADVGLPVVLYNIPGRTGKAIELETTVRLAEHPNVVAVKEAAGSVDQVSRLVQHCDLTVLSGDDVLTLPMMSVGGHGVVSVASNIIPGPVSKMVKAAAAGDWTEARAIHQKYYRLFNALLSLDSNPVPIKTAMALMGLAEEQFRLPMCPMGDEPKGTLRGVLGDMGLLG